jgi:hypothetical protein
MLEAVERCTAFEKLVTVKTAVVDSHVIDLVSYSGTKGWYDDT